MPEKTSWHSEPPATWLFNFNGLHQMFQAKGPRETRTDGLQSPQNVALPGILPRLSLSLSKVPGAQWLGVEWPFDSSMPLEQTPGPLLVGG